MLDFAVGVSRNWRCERRLVIVESPAKAKTIAGYLADDEIYGRSPGLGHTGLSARPRRSDRCRTM